MTLKKDPKLLKAIRQVMDPELRESIVDLGLIYDVEVVSDQKAVVTMTLTTPFCPLAPTIQTDIEKAVRSVHNFETVEINLVWDPPWDASTMASDEIKDKLGLW